MTKPYALTLIDDMAKHVQTTLRRCPDRMGDSLIRMTGGMLRHCLRHHLRGNAAHPGKAKMAQMGRCTERQVKRNLRQLEAWEVLLPVADAKGGRRATRYVVDLAALKRVLVMLKCNPSEDLFERIDAVSARLRGDMRGDMRGDTMSPGIHRDTSAPSLDGNVVNLHRRDRA